MKRRRAIAAVHEGDMLTTQMAVLKRFGKRGGGRYDRAAAEGGRGGAGAGPVSVRGAVGHLLDVRIRIGS